MILVIGSTGNVGSKLVNELIQRNVNFRALVHKEADEQRLRASGIDAVWGDITKRASLRPALEGVDTVYLLSPSNPRLAEVEGGIVDEAKQAGVRKIVKHSVLGADIHAESPLTQIHGYAEEAVKASGLAYTFLHLNSFMQNFVTAHAWSILQQGTFYEALGDARVSHVDTRDVALAAATVLTEGGHDGKSYDITGPEALSNDEIAALVTKILGKKVTYTPIPDEAMRQGLLRAGLSEWYADSVVKLYHFFRQGGGSVVTPDLERLLRHRPRTMDRYLQDHVEALQGR